MAAEMAQPVPVVTSTNRRFFEEAAKGHLALQRCGRCGALIYFPRVACPRCLATEKLEWTIVSGRGTVYSFAIVYRPQHPAFFSRVPIVLAAIKLAEGPLMISTLENVPVDEATIGMRVVMTPEFFEPTLAIPKFRPDVAS